MNNTTTTPPNKPDFPWRKALYTAALALLIPLIILAVFVEDPIELILDYGQFFLLGLAGAIVANSTGAGGGVVFIPAFTSMGVVGVSALGTSLAIQSFGMTAGSISWLHSIYTHQHGGKQAVKLTHRLLLLAGLSSVAGMLSAQYLFAAPTWPVDAIFKVFSIIFGLVLLFTILQRKAQGHTHYSLRRRDQPLIALVCFFWWCDHQLDFGGIWRVVSHTIIFFRLSHHGCGLCGRVHFVNDRAGGASLSHLGGRQRVLENTAICRASCGGRRQYCSLIGPTFRAGKVKNFFCGLGAGHRTSYVTSCEPLRAMNRNELGIVQGGKLDALLHNKLSRVLCRLGLLIGIILSII